MSATLVLEQDEATRAQTQVQPFPVIPVPANEPILCPRTARSNVQYLEASILGCPREGEERIDIIERAKLSVLVLRACDCIASMLLTGTVTAKRPIAKRFALH
jgi:hypothetical protein